MGRSILVVFTVMCFTHFHRILGGSDRVLLSDIQTLTLHAGRMTNGRRSSPVPQLKCVGGTAGCSSFRPQVVQCYNRGTDGYDIQWECKTDMDNDFRFGKVEVTCEGYDHSDDPYILRGSCGLEYTLDLTKEGLRKQKPKKSWFGSEHDYYGTGSKWKSWFWSSDDYQHKGEYKSGSTIGFFFPLLIIACCGYCCYKVCLRPSSRCRAAGDDPYKYASAPPPPSQEPPSYSNLYPNLNQESYQQQQPPAAGFTTGTTGGQPSSTATGSGGFWTGAATGGLLGYLFGSRGNTRHYSPPRNTGWFSGWGGRDSSWGSSSGQSSGWGGSSGWGSSGSSWGGGGGAGGDSGGSSSGTRTASGFGGTKRR